MPILIIFQISIVPEKFHKHFQGRPSSRCSMCICTSTFSAPPRKCQVWGFNLPLKVGSGPQVCPKSREPLSSPPQKSVLGAQALPWKSYTYPEIPCPVLHPHFLVLMAPLSIFILYIATIIFLQFGIHTEQNTLWCYILLIYSIFLQFFVIR